MEYQVFNLNRVLLHCLMYSLKFTDFLYWISIFLCLVQNKRGGKVKLQSILMPLSEFDHAEKGDALYG